MKNRVVLFIFIIIVILGSGIGYRYSLTDSGEKGLAVVENDTTEPENNKISDDILNNSEISTPDMNIEETIKKEKQHEFCFDELPQFDSSPYIEVNDNKPFFDKEEMPNLEELQFSSLDSLGRCGDARGTVGLANLPTEERGEIGSVKPSGWHTMNYHELIDGNYLYNRCHLIGYQLCGENANEKNLITGTRYLNVDGMLPYENKIVDYIKETGNHILYRVTPIFIEDELVARGVLMEAQSYESPDDEIQFCVFCYNVQPGILIDYSTGDSSIDDSCEKGRDIKEEQVSQGEIQTYILNKNSKKFHKSTCENVDTIKEKNKKEFVGTRDELIKQNYQSAGCCNP